ncbi:MAG: hypothetical protein JXR40_07915 [Pontiellaceae bacterium]|nr:hypothetical protein [Pontiellaceae bacterium]
MQIFNNIAALTVWRNYTGNVNGLRSSMYRLSSGNRINSAGDDPSGLAMSERLRAQSRYTAAAAGNVENRLNFLQTADSWMQKVQDMLGRMGELAVLANDDTKSDTEKNVLQEEFAQMQDEIARIVDDTGTNGAGKFNGMILFNGVSVSQQVGPDSGQEFSSTSADLTLDSAETISSGSNWGDLINSALADAASGLVGIGSDVEHDAGAAIDKVNAGVDFISEKRADIGAEMKRMNQTLDGLRNYEENIIAAESRIRDVDVAKETSNMSRFQILQQVSAAMLVQANQLPLGVLKLLQ